MELIFVDNLFVTWSFLPCSGSVYINRKKTPEMQKTVLFENYSGWRKKINSFSSLFSWHVFSLPVSGLLELFVFLFSYQFSSFSSFFSAVLKGYLGIAVAWDSAKWELTTSFSLMNLCGSLINLRHALPCLKVVTYFIIWSYCGRTKPTTCSCRECSAA